VATIKQRTSALLSDLRAINREIDRAAGASLPGAPGRTGRGGADRATSLELRQILRNTGEILGALRPSAADERSLLR